MFMRLYGWRMNEDESLPFVFVNIDDKAVKVGDDDALSVSWQDDGRVSRERLSAAVANILDISPAVLIVDVDLSYPKLDDRGNMDVVRTVCESQTTPVILAWMTDPRPELLTDRDTPKEPECVDAGDHAGAEKFSCVLRSCPGADRIHWTVPMVEADADLVVRRWPYCDGLSDDCTTREHLSVAALAAVIGLENAVTGEKDDTRRGRRKQQLADLKAQLLSPDAAEFRIVYTIPWEDGRASVTFADGTPLVISASPQAVVEAESLPSGWQRSIVLIGGSYRGQDMHQTPIGPMPGAMIIANTIHSLHQFGVVEEPSRLSTTIIAIAMITITSLTIYSLSDVVGGLRVSIPLAMVVLVAMTTLMSYMSVVLGWTAMWIDATLSCIGVVINACFAEERPLETQIASVNH